MKYELANIYVFNEKNVRNKKYFCEKISRSKYGLHA